MCTRIAVVSGSARGIGAATVRALLGEGYTVFGIDTLPFEEPLAVMPQCAERYQHHICDVSDEVGIAEVFNKVRDHAGKIDVLANVAGIVLVKPLVLTTWEEYRRTTDINLGGTFLACKHAIPLMPNGSAIVNTASISGHIGQTDHAIYAATKGAILALCRALAWELAPLGIRVNSVSPGSVDTAMLRFDIQVEAEKTGRSFAEIKADREAEQSLGRWAAPAEIAQAVVFLASQKSSFINGADLLVDSGWVAK